MAAVERTRLAKNYAIVYDALAARGVGRHLTAAQVLAEAKTRQPKIGETTVYRALARLRRLGLVSEISIPGSSGAVYELASSAHAHFYCESCGEIRDVAYVLPRDVLDDLSRAQNADVATVQLSLHGRCAACRDRAE